MKTAPRYRLNTIFLLCRAQGWTVSELSRRTGIERTRLHRLVHAQDLRAVITVGEALRIAESAPNFNFNF